MHLASKQGIQVPAPAFVVIGWCGAESRQRFSQRAARCSAKTGVFGALVLPNAHGLFEIAGMMKHLLLPLLLLLALLGGCNSAIQVGDIYVEVLTYTPSPDSDNDAQITVRYSNHNVYPIAIKSSSFKLYLEGDYVGFARMHEPIGIPQVSTGTRTVKLHIEKPGVIAKILASPASLVKYRLESNLLAEVIDDKADIKTRKDGVLPIESFKVAPAEKKTVQDAPTIK